MNLPNTAEKDGFAVLPGIVPEPVLTAIGEQCSAAQLQRSRAGIRHVLGIAAVSTLANGTGLTKIVQEVLGAEAFPFRATLFDKSITANWLIVWHQDTALPLRERRELAGWGPWSTKNNVRYAHAPASVLSQVLALRIHLDDSTAANGPLRVLPGTHDSGIFTDDQLHALSLRSSSIDCVVSKGGVVVMRPLLVHASSKSVSSVPRRVLHIEYAASSLIAAPLELACG